METTQRPEGQHDYGNSLQDSKPSWYQDLDNVEKPCARCPCKDWEPLFKGSSRGFCHYYQEFTKRGEQCI